MSNEPLLPIKVVLRGDGDDQPRPPAPRTHIPFIPVTNEVRTQLRLEVEEVRSAFQQSFAKFPHVPAVAKVSLRQEAIAKSHRPTTLFNSGGCPVIGVNQLGTLRVSVSPAGLDALSQTLSTGEGDEVLTHISAVQSIKPWTANDVVRLDDKQSSERAVRCELFFRADPQVNTAIEEAFLATLRDLHLARPTEVRYTPRTRVYKLQSMSRDQIFALAECVGVQQLGAFAEYHIVRTAARVIESLTPDALPPPPAGGVVGLVGIIDSGTDSTNPQLQAWVLDRLDMVAPNEQDNTHGSFVAGLIANGRSLNGGRIEFPDVSCRIIDVVAFDKTGAVSEDELLLTIDEAINKFPEVKVWNLSLTREGECCENDQFSSFASALDHRSRRHGVLFVVAAGNYRTLPLRGWPPPCGLTDDRISPPGDAAHALTVGSVAHLANERSLVRPGEPSPFSRRGPGSAYLVKPELTHFGGNCDANGRCVQTGIISVDAAGNIAEDIGVSFSTPLVSALSGHAWHELSADPTSPSPSLVKALLVHSAFMRSHPLERPGVDYLGFGTPGPAAEILHCQQSAATIIFRVSMASRVFLRHPFPMPKCLCSSSNRLRAEVFMTVVHDTPVDENYGPEYCRSNMAASLGTLLPSVTRKGRWTITRQIPPALGTPTEGFEIDLVEQGFKWSPIKLYYRKFTRGPGNAHWGLQLRRTDRQEFDGRNEEQEVAIIVTIRDPEREAQIYDELVTSMNQLGWITHDLQIRSRTRIQS